MTIGLPRWFRLIFTGVMIALCIVMVTQIVSHQSMAAEIMTLQGKIDSAEKRLAKQQQQLEEANANLPTTLAEAETASPAAQAAKARVAELKQLKKDLQQQNAAQEARIAELEAQLAALPSPEDTTGQVDAAINPLKEAQNALQD